MSAPEHPPTAPSGPPDGPPSSPVRSRPALPWQAVVAATVLALTAAAMVLVFASRGDDDPADETPRATLPLQPLEEGAGDRDPLDVEFTDVDGTTGTLRDLVDDRPVVVNFFAEWCTPCVKEMPDFQAVSQRLEGRVDFVGLAVNDRPEDTTRIVEETGITYPWTRDIRGDIASAAGVVNMPSTMFITDDGTIAELHTGAVDAERLLALIEEHLGVTP
jgi:thiol-disulfide isomerase/thioredoxin